MIPFILAGLGGYLIGDSMRVDSYKKGGLIAPNGKPSNLTPEQYKLVRTPEFKSWFGDWENNPENASKVVDENGEPLVVYRGMSKEASNNYIFDFKTQLLTSYGRVNKFGFYFTSDYDFAKSYADSYGYPNKGVIKSYFLKIKNICKIQSENKTQISQYELLDYLGLKDEYVKEYELKDWELKLFGKDIEGIVSPYNQKRSIHGFFVRFKGDKKPFDAFLKKNIIKKYDGLMFYEDYKQSYFDNYVCFKSNQIKLADGTNTTFDGGNPDIRYEVGGDV